MARNLSVILALALVTCGGVLAHAEKPKHTPPATAKAAAPAPPVPAQVQQAPTPSGDGRETIDLSASERARMLEGMRLYLQALQGIVEQLAANKLDGVAQYAHEAGAKMLQDAPMTIPLKAPMAFTALGLNTHEKFDVLADRARNASRGDVLNALADIMANCTGCHSTYRVVGQP